MCVCVCVHICMCVLYLWARVQSCVNFWPLICTPACFPKEHCTLKWRWIALSAFCRTIAACLTCIIYCVFAESCTCLCMHIHSAFWELIISSRLSNLESEHEQLCSCILKCEGMCVQCLHCVGVCTFCDIVFMAQNCLHTVVRNCLLLCLFLLYKRIAARITFQCVCALHLPAQASLVRILGY